jgi:hypothetical protein
MFAKFSHGQKESGNLLTVMNNIIALLFHLGQNIEVLIAVILIPTVVAVELIPED